VSGVSTTALLRLVGGLLLVGGLVYLANHPDDRVQKVCRRVQPGSSVADLNRYASEVGLSSRILPTGTTSLVAIRPIPTTRKQFRAARRFPSRRAAAYAAGDFSAR
jgi:hypothetical protein